MRNIRGFAPMAVLLAILTMCGLAQAQRADKDQLGGADQKFLKKAGEIDLAEIQLGKIAEEKALAAVILNFGKRMRSDHLKMNKELSAIARKKGIKLPKKLDPAQQKLKDQLSKLKGAGFDQAYAKDMVSDHEKAVMTFEAAIKTVQDPDLKAWAEKWLPILRQHLQLARETVKLAREAAR